VQRSAYSHSFGACLLAAALLLCCGRLLGIEPGERLVPGPEGGTSDSGGTNAGDAGSTAGEAGLAGAGALAAQGGVGDAGEIAAGAATGGSDSAPTPPDVGVGCEGEEVKACSSTNPRLLLQCAAGVWQGLATCRNLERCDPEQQQCRPLAADCKEHPDGHCDIDFLIDCADNPFVPPKRECPFGCANGACLPGTGDQLIVHTEPHRNGAMPWPDAPIAVCFSGGDSTRSLRHWTRSSVEQGWGRYLDIDFVGWETCESAETPGVHVEFLEDCRGRTASAVSLGYPGAGKQLIVGICRSYRDDAGGKLRDLEEAVVRFVALHQFGHVLGLHEADKAAVHYTGNIMARGIRSSTVAPMLWADDIAVLGSELGYKPEASIVHVSGWCLDTTGGQVALSRCSASEAQRLRPLADRLELAGTSNCLMVEGQTSLLGVYFTDCPLRVKYALALRRARWGTPGFCVAPRTLPVTPGTPVETRSCTEVGEVSQTWSFEVAATTEQRLQARIRFVAQDYCLAAPQELGGYGGVPTLEPCSSTDTLFELGPDGRVSLPVPETQERLCLNWVGKFGVLFFDFSCQYPFILSGPLETGEGRALEADPGNPGGGLLLSELGSSELPNLRQIFDVWF
jgi:hypothetical protein